MIDNKEEPLNVNSNRQKIKPTSITKKRRGSTVRQKKKEPSKLSSIRYYIIAFIIFIVLFCFCCYMIYKNLKKISEMEKAIKKRNKELEEGEKTRIELLDKIEDLEKQVELKKKEYKEKKKYDTEKLNEYNEQKKIYENIEKLQNEIEEENMISLTLDEGIINLNHRIGDLTK